MRTRLRAGGSVFKVGQTREYTTYPLRRVGYSDIRARRNEIPPQRHRPGAILVSLVSKVGRVEKGQV